ncbi:MAG: TIGR03905 family TSCPD domain-containing protein [Clostridiales bacterium]|nr:TIGR03905 family TSCPD domain-containing protein [Clostridiales bacterium]
MHYRTRGTCSTAIDLEIDNGIITACAFTDGCQGNAIGLSRMVVGQDALDVMHKLRGVPCQGPTSCPDQLSRAIEQYLNHAKDQQ